jgi:phosphatidylethanolamine-binding protein (PEBP) family uncharacterized protein
MRKQFVRCVLAAGTVLGLSAAPAAAQDFTISSSAFQDGGWLQLKNAGNNKANPNCIGENVSPPFAWSGVPAKATSLALLMFDPEGRGGAGVSHWVSYGIPVSVTGFAEGEVSKPSNKYVGGLGSNKESTYLGPCTPPRCGGPAAEAHPRGVFREVRREASDRDWPDRALDEEITR